MKSVRQFSFGTSCPLAVVRPCVALFSLIVSIPFFHFSYHSFTMILVLASSSCFTLDVPMREVSCVGYVLCAMAVSYSLC